MKNVFLPTLLVLCLSALVVRAATPEVSDVSMTQDGISRLVTVTYTLSDAPAVVTFDVQTNAVVNGATVWASIGGEAVCNAQGDVWRTVTGDGPHTITWRPDLSWPDHKIAAGGARAVVTAWALNNTPDYMVVDISAAAQPDTQRYYPAVEFLPGGILGNPDYRTTSIVMRKIMAKDVTWTMGSTSAETQRTAANEATHKVTLDSNYYIGVFEVTQTQWAMVDTAVRPWMAWFRDNLADRPMRPVEQQSFNEIRNNAVGTTTDNAACDYPNPPHASSWLGLLRTKTGIDFDLPSEAQWEFAARAGHGSPYYGDGSVIKNGTTVDSNFERQGRYKWNGPCDPGSGSWYDTTTSASSAQGTAVCGSYAPNDWGLYDTLGNVLEWCLDKFSADISGLTGAVCMTGSDRVMRGGSWRSNAPDARPALRTCQTANTRVWHTGFRLACPAAIE